MGEREHARIDQRVMHDDIGLGKAGERMQREQARIAWPRAGKPDMTSSKGGSPAKAVRKLSVMPGIPRVTGRRQSTIHLP